MSIAQKEATMTTLAETTITESAVRPFHVSMPDEALVELRRSIAATRWPGKELVPDQSQGVQLAMLQELAHYWATEYDWRACEAKLNALPQFMTEIDGVDIHFIHVKSPHEHALPLIITHGWPGSVIEMIEVIGPLTDPTAYGGSAEDAFDLVLPSLPGYGFSGEPTEVGWGPARVAQAWVKLMDRLGYTHYVAQGGDQGAGVTDAMGRLAPEGLLGVHFNFLDAAPRELLMAALGLRLAWSEAERAEFGRFAGILKRGYLAEMGEHPQTIGYALTATPVGLAAWMLDHDADSYEKISRAFLDGQPSGNLTRDRVVDNMTLYWLTNTAASSARLYWENSRSVTAAIKQPPPHVSLPVAFTVFPGEIFQAPRHWVKSVYHNLIYFHEVDRGGHFAAWEEPQLFAEELRAAFSSLREGESS
jgi:pimeloyl-ACP methyl ester carboxylesterase